MKRRSFFGWLGAAIAGGFAGLLGRETQEQKLLRLIREAEKDPSAWRVYASGEDVTKDVRDLVLRCKKCGARYDPISEKRRFDEHVAQCRVLPETLDTDHPEARNIEVIGLDGKPMPLVRAVNTRTKTAQQYRRLIQTDEDRRRYAAAAFPPPATAIVQDPVTMEPLVFDAPYDHLRLRDGRDVLEVLGV